MAQTQIPNSLRRLFIVALSLIFLSTSVVVIIGTTTKSINLEVKKIESFLRHTEEIRLNFERSLEMYTGQTKDIINYLLSLRPSSEEGLVNAISQIEHIGQKLKLQIDLRLIENIFKKDEEKEGSLQYDVTFYGGINEVEEFLTELEKLHFYTKVESIRFKAPEFLEPTQLEAKPNISMNIKLFTK